MAVTDLVLSAGQLDVLPSNLDLALAERFPLTEHGRRAHPVIGGIPLGGPSSVFARSPDKNTARYQGPRRSDHPRVLVLGARRLSAMTARLADNYTGRATLVATRVIPEDIERLDRIRQTHGRSRAEFIRYALKAALDAEELAKPDSPANQAVA